MLGPEETCIGIFGDINFRAPEVLEGLPYNWKADSWSLGVIIFHMLTGSYPFSTAYSPSLKQDIIKGSPNLSLLRDMCYSELVIDLVSKLL